VPPSTKDEINFAHKPCRVPSGAVHDKHGLHTWRDLAADLLDVELHGFGVCVRQSERCSDTACWADGAQEIDIFIALIGWLPWSCSALRA
jgi:hypothetical protein